MISTTRRSPNATLVPQSAIDQAAETLQSLPEKPKERLSLREAVDALREHITAALEKGYSYEDITAMLANQGVLIAPSSLKHYLARSNRQLRGKGTGTRRQRSTSQSSPAEIEDAEIEDAEIEDAEMEDVGMEEIGMEEIEMEDASLQEQAVPPTTELEEVAQSPAKTTSRSTTRRKSTSTPTRKRQTRATS